MPSDTPHRSFTPAGLRLLGQYRRDWLRPDVLAGVTVAAYLVPQVMAYAGVAGLAPVVRLWAIFGSLLMYAVFGSSRQLSVGPESTTALMTAVTIAPLAAGDPSRYAALATALALLVGVLRLLGAAARLGSRRSPVPARPGRLHGRRRRAHDRRPCSARSPACGSPAARSSTRSARSPGN